ncbi:MAG: hypothetical protein AB1798_09115 [Spirochaetota bacterium]
MVSRLHYPDFKRISLAQLRLSKLVLVVAVTSGIAIINPRKLIFLPLTVYTLYGFKEYLLAAWKNRRHNLTDR